MRIVVKFGGTSLADAEHISRCADLIRRHQEKHDVVTVVSAMARVTGMLLELADSAAAGNGAAKHTLLGQLRSQHEDAARALGAMEQVGPILDRLETLVSGVAAVGELTPRSRDAVVAFGELLSSALMAAALEGRALTGQEVGIVTDEAFGEAEPLKDLSFYQIKKMLEPALARRESIVVTGFLAATQHGVLTTLGRGGSDYTATLVGAALGVTEVWICSDVVGLMTADPRIVSDARLLESITFAEAIEMGQFGAKSMHPRALEPAAEHGIPVRIRSSFDSDEVGTLIADGAPTDHTIRSVLLLRDVALVTVGGAAMVGRPGTAARIFQVLADSTVNVRMISQTVSEAGISIVIARSQLDRARAAIRSRLVRTKKVKNIDVVEDAAVVAVVGSRMNGTPGVAARVFGALGERNLNVLAIAQGSSERSICFVLNADAGPTAVRSLHDEFRLGTVSTENSTQGTSRFDTV